MRRKEIDIPASDASTGANLALENAKRHLASADAIAALKEYGMACGHVVLAIEESAKACFLAYHSLGLPITRSMQKNVMARHDFRHGLTSINLLFMEIFRIYEKHINLGSQEMKSLSTEEEKKGVRNRSIQSIIRDMELLAENGPEMSYITSILTWLKQANEKKNAAFYVDYADGSWRSPSKIAHAVFIKGRETAVKAIELHENIVKIATDIPAAERDAIIKNLKKDLATFPNIEKLLQKDA